MEKYYLYSDGQENTGLPYGKPLEDAVSFFEGLFPAFFNFILVLLVFFVFVWMDGLPFTWKFICLLYPIVCMLLFHISVGMVLSAMFVFIRDINIFMIF